MDGTPLAKGRPILVGLAVQEGPTERTDAPLPPAVPPGERAAAPPEEEPVRRRAPLSERERRRRFMRTAVAFYGLLMAVPLWWKAASEGSGLFYPEGFSVADTVGGLITGSLAGLALVALSALATRHSRWGRVLAEAFAALLGRLSRREIWALALLSGFGEEMFFRGLLQPYLGLVVTSLIFGLVHFIPRREFVPWTLFSIGAGFLLGWLYIFAGTLLAPIACHVIVNGINLGRIVKTEGA